MRSTTVTSRIVLLAALVACPELVLAAPPAVVGRGGPPVDVMRGRSSERHQGAEDSPSHPSGADEESGPSAVGHPTEFTVDPASLVRTGCRNQLRSMSVIPEANALGMVVDLVRDVTLTVTLDDDRAGTDDAYVVAELPVQRGLRSLTIPGLSAFTPYRLQIDNSCLHATWRGRTASPAWPSGDVCPVGVPLAPLGNPSTSWRTFSDRPAPRPDAALGVLSQGDGETRFQFQFNEGTVLLARPRIDLDLDLDLTSHACLPIRGLVQGPDVAVMVIARGPDLDPTRGEALAWIRLEELADLPVKRAWSFSTSEFEPLWGELDRAHVKGFDLGVACRADDVWSPCPEIGTWGELAWGDLVGYDAGQVASTPTGLEEPVVRGGVAALLAQGLAAETSVCSPLAPEGHRPGSTVRYSYSNGLVLSALAHATLLGEPHGEATRRLADAFVELQGDDGGFCAYQFTNGCGAFKSGSCQGAAGPSAYVGLGLLQAEALDGGRYEASVDALIGFYAAKLAREGEVDASTEGNLSAYLFLSAASRVGHAVSPSDLEVLAARIELAWFARESRFLPSLGSFINPLDVGGPLAIAFLEERGDHARALEVAGMARALFATRSFDGSMIGFGDVLGPWTVNGEWGAGMYANFGGLDSNFAFESYLAQVSPGGLLPGSPDTFYADFLIANDQAPSLPATAWAYHAARGEHFPLRLGSE